MPGYAPAFAGGTSVLFEATSPELDFFSVVLVGFVLVPAGGAPPRDVQYARLFGFSWFEWLLAFARDPLAMSSSMRPSCVGPHDGRKAPATNRHGANWVT
jgi:hypothetical protein